MPCKPIPCKPPHAFHPNRQGTGINVRTVSDRHTHANSSLCPSPRLPSPPLPPQGTGINVYTHGEMLPAHGYPGLKKYPHLAGHYGGAWYRQKVDFANFPGAIAVTTNCVLDPLHAYKDNIWTINEVRGAVAPEGTPRFCLRRPAHSPGR